MKKKKPYYLKMYKSWASAGKLPMRRAIGFGPINPNGLCCVHSICKAELNIFEPTANDYKELSTEGLCKAWWASGLPAAQDSDELASLFTPLRQTIVLFLAAMNDEL